MKENKRKLFIKNYCYKAIYNKITLTYIKEIIIICKITICLEKIDTCIIKLFFLY